MIREGICMRALSVEFLLGQRCGTLDIMGLPVVLALLALGWRRLIRHRILWRLRRPCDCQNVQYVN